MTQNTEQFNTPILLIVFNRPDTTQKVLDQIFKVKPKQIFVFIDGPRNEQDRVQAEIIKQMLSVQLDWPCELKIKHETKNLGCGIGPVKAITWFFENVEKGIILEDDCVPNRSFFYYCQGLLNTFNTGNGVAEDDKVMVVSGNNFQQGKKRGDASYYFSIFPNTWGWATWKKSWELFDFAIRDLPKFKSENKIAQYFSDKKSQDHWLCIFDKVYGGKRTDIWDYQWLFSIWNNGGLSVVPNENLVSNVGFDTRATHTKSFDPRITNLKTKELEFPLRHPIMQIADSKADLYTFEYLFLRKRSFLWWLQNKIKKYLN